MKKLFAICVFAAFIGAPVAADEDEFDVLEHDIIKLALSKAKIGMKQAIDAAVKEAGNAKLAEAELSVDGDTPVFEFGFLTEGGGMEITVDAVTGKVLKKEEEKPDAHEAEEYKQTLKGLNDSKFTLLQAIDAATSEAKGGTVVQAEAEVEDGKFGFEVEVVSGDEFKEVQIDANGKVVKTEVEKAEGQAWIFDHEEGGKAPLGWKFGYTNPADGKAAWAIAKDPKAMSGPNVLSLDSKSDGNVFNLAMAEKTSYQDVDVRTRIRANSGKEDQGGGVIWRAKDANNYYICRINPLEGNYRVYKVVDGKRTQLETAKLDMESGRWYEVRAVMVGDRMECFVDGKKYLEARDDVFKDAGMVGLWTKADASSSFDDVVVSTPDSDDHHDAHDDEQAILWEAAPVEQAPRIDGVEDKLWSGAKPAEVVVREAIGGAGPRTVTLRAVYTKDTLYVLAQWPDATRSDMRDPYVWNAAKTAYERPTKPDDQFALEFPISGQFDRNMLSTEREFEADVWHWKAGRGNPNGWVDDKRHIIRHSSFEGAKEYRLGGHATVFIARPNDIGTVPYKTRPAPTSQTGDVVDSFEPQEPTGSCADVRGKGAHDGSMWTLEMARKLSTGQPDDAVLNLDRDNPCAIAVLDDELYWHHSVSPLIHLRFEPR